MKLDLYFARRYARALLMVTAIFAALILMVQSVEEIRVLSKAGVGVGASFRVAVLSVPTRLYEILPIVVTIATLVLFLGLARSSELVVARAAGRSALRYLVPPVVVALLFGVLSVAVINPIAATTERHYESLRTTYLDGAQQVFSVSDEGLWLREGNADGQRVIRATRSNLDGSELYDVTFLGFDAEGVPLERIEAATARISDSDWVLERVKKWPLEGSLNPEADSIQLDTLNLPTTLTLDEIRDRFGSPKSVQIWEMRAFIERLESAGFSARAYKMWLQSELALPLSFVAMVLIGAGFTMRHARLGSNAVNVITAIILAFGFFFLISFARILGENGELPIPVAAWAPPIAVILAALALLLHLEDG
ncbi:LPS export ABC transporter permease LptG [Celeribacter arenosi]|uniref:LPS export ABC transporter permease LptG n=1 Tax=Celeribacter arenosi TaxID=792649 RepID=A0ABP7KG51_9RHOB